jgi:glutamine amidotransferase
MTDPFWVGCEGTTRTFLGAVRIVDPNAPQETKYPPIAVGISLFEILLLEITHRALFVEGNKEETDKHPILAVVHILKLTDAVDPSRNVDMHSPSMADVCYIRNMCRMLFAALPDSDLDRGAVLRAFLSLAERGRVPKTAKPGHHDGWGYAAYARGSQLRHYRSEASGTRDPLLANELFLLDAHKPDALLAHVRKQTIGEPSERNSHPFVAGNFSFVHNGTLGDPEQEVFGPVRDRPEGETDSELYFHLVIKDLDSSEMRDKERIAAAIVEVVRVLRRETSFRGGGFTSASSILCDGRYAYVLREFDERHPAIHAGDSETYYTLYMGKGMRGELIISSEKLDLPDVFWELLPNHSLTVVDIVEETYDTRTI